MLLDLVLETGLTFFTTCFTDVGFTDSDDLQLHITNDSLSNNK